MTAARVRPMMLNGSSKDIEKSAHQGLDEESESSMEGDRRGSRARTRHCMRGDDDVLGAESSAPAPCSIQTRTEDFPAQLLAQVGWERWRRRKVQEAELGFLGASVGKASRARTRCSCSCTEETTVPGKVSWEEKKDRLAG
jgi:hypothetical protein